MTAAPAAEADLREALAAWEFARHAPARYWSSGALDGLEADARSAADELLALPALRGLVEQAAEAARLRAVVARVEKVATTCRTMGLTLHSVPHAETYTEIAIDLQRALGEDGQ